MVIAILTVLSGGPFANPMSDDSSRQKETDENVAWRRPMKNELKHRAGMRSARIVWTARGPPCLCESSAEYRETTV